MHSLKHLYDHIHLHHDAQKISLIQEHGITQQELDALVKDAQPDGGVLPNYIPQLEHIEHPAETIIIVRDST